MASSEEQLRDARRALTRLRRTVEKARRELGSAAASLSAADPDLASGQPWSRAEEGLNAVDDLIEEQMTLLQQAILQGALKGAPGGPGRAGL